ncbi:MAG: helix-turn-helix domain-containing protein [Pseudomonadota bacterium]|nr:helix-turn-helix domain-containing protein [Pseudomonadota bacterium]
MSSSSRVFAVLGLFSKQRSVWHTDDINAALGYSRASGYRYVKELVEAGLLQKVAAGRYALGARIIELDYQLRQSDPVLLAAAPIMDGLAKRSGFDVVLSTLFGRTRVIDTHRIGPGSALRLAYGRGRPRPLFRGAAPKVMLAALPRAALKAIYDRHVEEIAAAGLATTWAEFRRCMGRIQEAGFYISLGEVEERVGAAAVPILNAEGELLAALALVGTDEALRAAGQSRLVQWLHDAARTVKSTIAKQEYIVLQ